VAFLVDSVLGKRRPPSVVVKLIGLQQARLILFVVLLGLAIVL
jgi:hypothetical protein